MTNPHHPHIPPTYHTTPSASNQGRLPSVLYPHVPFPPPSAHHQQAEARPSNVHEATTVRNLVNLRKNSLKLSPRAGSPQILDISFMLDIVSECRCVTPSPGLNCPLGSWLKWASSEHGTGVPMHQVVCLPCKLSQYSRCDKTTCVSPSVDTGSDMALLQCDSGVHRAGLAFS